MKASLSPEQVLIRRTAWRVMLVTAALFTVCLLALAGIAATLILRAQNADGQRLLTTAVSDADAVSDPPSGIVIYQVQGGQVRASPSLGGRPLDPQAIAAVTAGRGKVTGEVTVGGREYQVRTTRRGDVVVQAGLDLTDRDRERRHLIRALIVASAIGLLAALGIGYYVARRAVRPLELAATRQRRFVADASHELRTPLTQAHTRAQMLHRALAASDTPAELVNEAGQMVRSTRLLADIIDELLLSAQQGADATMVSPVDLATTAAAAMEAEQARARSRDITLRLRRDDGPHVVPGSPTALRRVLNSLIDNAFGHVDDGGHITVTLRRGQTDRPDVECAVIDDGHGFDPGRAETMFERFARGDHGDPRRFGLGLALVREVIQAHGGTIVATASPERGATFTITLPAYSDGAPG